VSFGLSSGGGQVRYALIVDDQATAKLNTFRNSLTTLGSGTTKLSRDMTVLNNSFSAGVTPIKNTGNAMNQLVNTHKTLGSQLGGLATGFKNNALAIGAAASSVLGLYQNYANLSSAQNAANKSATAAKAAQNSVTTATKALSTAIGKYGQGSKEAKAAQDKLTVAQERAVNKTESAKIAQDNLNQTMADFGINILPNVLLAGGSITSIFDNIGTKGKGLGGVISKLSGAFGGLGGATGALKGGMAGLLTTLGPLALVLGGIAAALLYAKDTAEVSAKAMEEFKKAAKLEDVTKSVQGMNAALDKLKLSPGIGSLKEIGDLIASLGAGGLRNNFVDQAKKMASEAKIAASNVGKLAEAEKKLDADEAALASKRKERQTTSVKQEVQHLEAVVKDDKAEIARLKTVQKVNELKTKTIALTQDELNIISRRNEAMAKARQQDIDVAAALGEVISKTTAAADGAKRMAEEVKLENDAMKNILPNIVKQAESLKTTAEATKLVGDMVKLSKDRMGEWNAAIDQVAIHNQEAEASFKNLAKTMKADLEKAAADAQTAIDKMRGGVQSGLDKIIEAFHKVHKKGKLDFEVNFDKAKKGFDKFLAEVGDKLDHGGAANAQKYILAFEKKGTAGMSKSSARMFQPLFDWIEKHKDEPADVFMSGFLQMLSTFDPKVSQQFKKLLDPTIGLSEDIGKKAGKAFSEELMAAINSTLKIADRFASQGAHPGRGSLKDTSPVKIPTEFIPPKTPVPTPKTPVQIPSLFKTPPPIPSPKTPVKVPAILTLNASFSGKVGTGGGATGGIDFGGLKLPVTVPAKLGFGPPTGGTPGLTANEFTRPKSKGLEGDFATLKPSEIEPPSNYFGTQPGDAYGDLYKEPDYPFPHRPKPEDPLRIPPGTYQPTSAWMRGGGSGTGQQGAYGGPAKTPAKMGLPVIDQTAFQKGLQLAINNAAQTVQLITAAITKLASVVLPVVSQVKFQQGLQVAINNAAQTVQIIQTTLVKVSSIQVPTPNESTYQKGLQLAINNAAQTVQLIGKELAKIAKIKVPAPNESTYQKGLQLAIDNAAQTVKLIASTLKKISSIKVPAPNESTYQKGLQLAINNAKQTVDLIKKELNKVADIKVPAPNTSSVKTDSSKGDTSGIFVGGSKSDSGGTEITIINNIMDDSIMRKVTARSGKNRFVFGV
jgi:hypothetical protein